MDYFLYKLKFDGAVHFGQSESALSLYTTADHFRADTFFSARPCFRRTARPFTISIAG